MGKKLCALIAKIRNCGMASPGKDITEKSCSLYDYVGSLHLPIISACKSAIVSPYAPAL